MRYYGDKWWLYLALLLRTDINPKRVIKIGVTNAIDPMMRLCYQKADEPHPIIKYFHDIQIMEYIAFDKEWEAKKHERIIMGMVKRKFNSPFFHNWREKDKISGITEMRIYEKAVFDFIRNYFKKL